MGLNLNGIWGCRSQTQLWCYLHRTGAVLLKGCGCSAIPCVHVRSNRPQTLLKCSVLLLTVINYLVPLIIKNVYFSTG